MKSEMLFVSMIFKSIAYIELKLFIEIYLLSHMKKLYL